MEFGFIYKITCIPTRKIYVGQAREHKHKNGKPYTHGIQGRWNDHVSSSKKMKSAFAEAIKTYGRDAFKVEELEKAHLEKLDALEAKWISQLNSIVPNGYNTARHSQNKHREHSNLYEFFQGKVKQAILRKIHRKNILRIVYVILELNDGTTRRIVFGNNKDDTFESAWESANVFIEQLSCPYSEDTSYSTDPLERYAKKIEEYKTMDITKIRITNANNLAAVYITTSDMTSWKDQYRICFGGKTLPDDYAYELAKLFVEQLPKRAQTLIQDTYRCPQQANALMGEASP
jgi:hypothetical protein